MGYRHYLGIIPKEDFKKIDSIFIINNKNEDEDEDPIICELLEKAGMQTDSELWWNKERNKLKQALKEKEQECEKLKIKLEQSMYLSKGSLILYSNRKNSKYKRALDEIEELAKRTNGACFYDDIDNCENCDMNFGCSSFNLRKIKRIINKVKGINNDR